ncbi:hypothetical protein Tco_0879500 [Tanacetum coccineum]
MLQARENLMEAIQAFLKEYDHIPPKEKCMALLLAEERFLKIKQAVEEEQMQPKVMQELLLKLMKDLQILNGIQPKQEEPVAQSFLLNWNFPMVDDDEYTIIYRKPKAITPDLPTDVENLVPIPSESKGIFDDIFDVPSCDNDHFNAEFGLINSLLSRDISITSSKIDFLPEEFAGKLNLIDPILPGIDKDDFDEEEGAIDNDILQIEDKILHEKLLNIKLLIDKIEALNHTPSTPFVLEYPSSSPIPVVDSDFLIEEVDTFFISEDSIPPDIENDLGSEENIIFLDDFLNDDPIPQGGEINVSQNVEDDDSFTFVIRTFLPFLTYLDDSPLPLSTGSEDTILTQASPLRAGGISSGWNFHLL